MLVYFWSNCYYNAINIYDLPDLTDFTMVKLTWGGTLGRRKITLEYYGDTHFLYLWFFATKNIDSQDDILLITNFKHFLVSSG